MNLSIQSIDRIFMTSFTQEINFPKQFQFAEKQIAKKKTVMVFLVILSLKHQC